MRVLTRRSVGIILTSMLCACDAPAVSDPEANLSANRAVSTFREPVPQPDPRPAIERNAVTGKEPPMPVPKTPMSAAPKPPAKPAPVPLRPATPKREIQPSPFQPPAEIDPPHVNPGDEVPR